MLLFIVPGSMARGVGHRAFAITCSDVIAVRFAFVPSRSPIRFFIAKWASGDLSSSFAVAVGHNPDPLPTVRSIDGTSRNTKRPCGVLTGFQVRKHSVEAHLNVSSNILSKHPTGPAFSHEPIHFRPEVAVIFLAALLPGDTKGLAWIPAYPNRSVIGPACHSQPESEAADPGEEVDLGVSFEVIGLDFLYVAVVNVAVWQMTGIDEVAKPLDAIGIDLVVISRCAHKPNAGLVSWYWSQNADASQ